MSDRCPICRALLTDPPLCRRCGADLGPALVCRTKAEAALAAAMGALSRGEAAQARAWLRQALRLHATPLSTALLAWAVRDCKVSQSHSP